MSAVDYCICIEELARVDPGVALSVAAHNGLCSAHILLFGTDDAEGDAICRRSRAARRSAPGGSPNPRRAAMPPACVPRPSGLARVGCLNGSKTFTTHGRVGDVMVVMAVTDQAAGRKGSPPSSSSSGTPGMTAGQEGRQARHARERHQRGAVRELPHARRRSCSVRRGRASSTPCRCSMPAASASRRCRLAWRRARTKRRCSYAQERKAFGGTDQHVPGDSVEAGRQRHAHRGGAPAHVSRRLPEGPAARPGRRWSRRWPSCTRARSRSGRRTTACRSMAATAS